MAKRQFELTEDEIAGLRQREQQTRDVYELRRLQAVRLYGSGVSTHEIANVVGCGTGIVASLRRSIPDDNVILIVAPPHLIEKWEREPCSLSTQVVVERIESRGDLKAFEVHERIPVCPHCGTVVTQESKAGAKVASEAWLRAGKRTCACCLGPLWQESRGGAGKSRNGDKPHSNPATGSTST